MPATTLRPGLHHQFAYRVPPERTVAHLLPGADEFGTMPEVLTTSYLVWIAMRMAVSAR